MSQRREKTPVPASFHEISYEKQMRIFKIIVLGDSYVGKTCLTYRFCDQKFPKMTEATIGVDFREKKVLVDGEWVKLQLWDTAGQERFRKSMIPHYYRNVHGIIFVYDVTKMMSFTNLQHWIDECYAYNLSPKTMPCMLVGNKCDCVNEIAVPTSTAQRFADEYYMPHFVTSAADDKEASNVDGIFITLANKLKFSKPLMPVSVEDEDKPIVIKQFESPSPSDSSCCC